MSVEHRRPHKLYVSFMKRIKGAGVNKGAYITCEIYTSNVSLHNLIKGNIYKMSVHHTHPMAAAGPRRTQMSVGQRNLLEKH